MGLLSVLRTSSMGQHRAAVAHSVHCTSAGLYVLATNGERFLLQVTKGRKVRTVGCSVITALFVCIVSPAD